MTRIEDMSIVSFLSVKGGTGKTTTALGLASLLMKYTPVTIIEWQRENPQYRNLLFPEGVEIEKNVIEHKINIIKEEMPEEMPISYVINSPVFKDHKNSQNLSLLLLNAPKGRSATDGIKLPAVSGSLIVSGDEMDVRTQSKKIIAISKHFDTKTHLVITDYDAGLENIMGILPFYRAVKGYSLEQALAEESALFNNFTLDDFLFSVHSAIFRQTKNITSAAPRCFNEFGELNYDLNEIYKKSNDNTYTSSSSYRFNNGIIVFVASPAIAEVHALKDRAAFFRDLGPNNKYVLILNQTTEENVEEIEQYLRKKMGKSFMFNRVFGLPQIPYMEFGNITKNGNPFLLPTFSDRSECIEYKDKLMAVSEYILSQKM